MANNQTTLSVEVRDLFEMHLTKANTNKTNPKIDSGIKIISADPMLIKFNIVGGGEISSRKFIL